MVPASVGIYHLSAVFIAGLTHKVTTRGPCLLHAVAVPIIITPTPRTSPDETTYIIDPPSSTTDYSHRAPDGWAGANKNEPRVAKIATPFRKYRNFYAFIGIGGLSDKVCVTSMNNTLHIFQLINHRRHTFQEMS